MLESLSTKDIDFSKFLLRFEDLRNELKKVFSKQHLLNYRECLIVSKRVTLGLSDVFIYIVDALKNIKFRKFDLCAEDLKKAHTLVKNIIGNDASDELLDTIFSKFCIGK